MELRTTSGLDQAEAELRASEQRIRLIVDAANDAFVAMNGEGMITEWNRQAEITFGWQRSETIGRSLADTIIPQQYRAAHSRGLLHFLATGEGPVLNRVIEVNALRRDGHEFPVELTIAPIRLDGQHLFGAFLRDITQRKQVEAELHQAKAAAAAASRAKSEFLANMSHEIRTPMNGILGMTELALDTELNREQREYLNMVKASAESLLAIIDDILDFSKIEAGKLRLDPIEFSIRDSLGQMMKSLAHRAQQKGLELACHVPPTVPDGLRGDPGRLRQVLMNLIGNAIKFTDAGEVVIDVAMGRPIDGEVLLHFSVRDTGIGIPPEKQQLIFEPFTQADSSMARHYGGTGLGLTISARLVELMGGRVQLESNSSTGSTFHFTARFGLVSRAVDSRAMARPESIEGLRVLVVDDNETNRYILREMLENWQMRPRVVDGARAALSALEQAAAVGEPYPLVLLDAMMPGMDGFALAEQIKCRRELAGAVLLMLSSAARPEDADRCRQLGIATYLVKPINQSELLDAILTARRAAGDVPEASVTCGTKTGATTADDRRLRVLLAEDNLVNQRLATRILEKRGHEVVVVANGLEAVAALERGVFDVVLMDVQMPQLSGFEAAAAIRKKESLEGLSRRIPIIAITAYAMRGDRERCLEAGMDHYIAKPIRAEELIDAVNRVVTCEGIGEGHAGCAPAADEEVDIVELNRNVAEDPGLRKEITATFLDTYAGMLDELKQAIDRDDLAAVQRTAHNFKGAVGIFGANKAFDGASRLESMARREDLSQAKETYGALVQAMEGFKPSLVRLLDDNNGSLST